MPGRRGVERPGAVLLGDPLLPPAQAQQHHHQRLEVRQIGTDNMTDVLIASSYHTTASLTLSSRNHFVNKIIFSLLQHPFQTWNLDHFVFV